MPYEWIKPEVPVAKSAPQAELHLWPYRSLLRRDFVVFIAATVALIVVPLLAVIGSPVLWGLLPFFIIAVAGVWYAIHRSYKDGEILETLKIWPDRMTLDHVHPKFGHKTWDANPYWVQIKIDPKNERTPNYLTLKGSDREVELGAFLSEDERAVLYDELDHKLRDILRPQT
ncbi:MAG: DUF2244 domain-containing protein [Octadecabacter sp.]|nr:DUF2244 domain-containing protein [Octadecabacter sp.]